MESLNIVVVGKDQIEVRREAVPELRPGEILVEARTTLISTGTETIVLGRKFEPGTHWDAWVQYPMQLGYLCAGRVAQVGADVETFRIGDRVAARTPHAQFWASSAEHVLAIPDSVSDEAAVWFGLASIVQNGVRQAAHELGDSIVIIGLGPLGQLVTQYARLCGCWKIIAVDTARARLDLALAHGATHILEMGAAEAREKVWEITAGRGADVVYDVTGHPAVLSPALKLARKFGRLLLLGDTGTPSEQRLTADVVTRGLRIIGAHDSNPPATQSDHLFWTHCNMARLFFDYIERRQMDVSTLITHRYAPQNAPQAYQMLEDRRSDAMGVLFDWSHLDKE